MSDVGVAIGSYVGRYRVLGVQKKYARTTHLQAEDSLAPNSIALLKKYHSIMNRPDQQAVLTQRIKALRAFQHPCVLPILAAGIDRSALYVVTEQLTQGCLYDKLQNQPQYLLPRNEVLDILTRIGMALHAAHQANLVHGNLKTQNILFNDKGKAVLTDFSLLSPTDTDTTQTGGEQSYQGDRYAFGMIAYELFTGQPPFTIRSKQNPQKTYKVRWLIPPVQLNSTISAPINTALMRMLAKDTENYYNDIPTFLADIIQAETMSSFTSFSAGADKDISSAVMATRWVPPLSLPQIKNKKEVTYAAPVAPLAAPVLPRRHPYLWLHLFSRRRHLYLRLLQLSPR